MKLIPHLTTEKNKMFIMIIISGVYQINIIIEISLTERVRDIIGVYSHQQNQVFIPMKYV